MNHYTSQIAAVDPASADHSRPAFLCDHAIRLIDQYTQSPDKPFFLRLDFHGPHFPNVVPEPYFSMYDPASIAEWPNFADSLEGKPAVQRIKQKHWSNDVYDWSNWQPLLAAYFGEITLIDAQVGRVLDYLDESGIAENTLVIWTTDHGDTIGAHNICNKDYTMYEEIYAVPLIVRWPACVSEGAMNENYVHHFLDIYATLREIADGRAPANSHGRSLLPLLRGETIDDWTADAYCEFHGSHMGLYSMRLLTDDNYTYIYHTNDIDEFYDRRTDRHQLHNLAEAPGVHANALAMRRRRMVEWMSATNDHLFNEWTVLWLTGDESLAAEAPGRRRTKW